MAHTFTKNEVRFVRIMATWLLASTALITFAVAGNPIMRAVLEMGWGLILLWVVLGGLLMLRYRDPIRQRVEAIGLKWQLKFVLFATLLALVEEAVTTTMTNCAPLFGVKVGQAYITASANYIDVVTMHSVIVLVPLFVGWATMLSYVKFRPFAVFLLFGVTGTLAESLYGGPQHLLEFGMWLFVYGLMVFLPAYCIPQDRQAGPARWWHYPVAVFLPFLFELIVPVAAIPHWISPHHPDVHFPPIKP
jgi:hypothetical protein